VVLVYPKKPDVCLLEGITEFIIRETDLIRVWSKTPVQTFYISSEKGIRSVFNLVESMTM
jgi:hypothetical protein